MKIEEQVLSREQMAHLVELGVDTSDASMAWFMSPKTKQWKIKVKNNFSHELLLRLSPERYIPAYTIGDLIEKLPSNIDGYGFKATIKKSPNYNYPWTELVYDNEGVCTEYITSKVNPIHALYGFLCYVATYHKELIK